MANIFDQFDSAPTAAPQEAGQEAPAARPSYALPPKANPFNQFDAAPAPAAAGPKSEWEVDWDQAAKNAAARASYSAYGTLGDIIGLAAAPVYTAIDVAAGTDLSKRYKPALGSEWLAERAQEWLGWENPYSPEGKSRAQRYAEAAGEFAALFALPSPTAKTRMAKIAAEYGPELVEFLPRTIGEDVRRGIMELMGGAGPQAVEGVGDVARVGGAALTGAAAGVGAEAAQEFAPEPLKPTAALLGTLGGAGAATAVGAGARAVTEGVGSYLRPARAALGSRKAREQLAAQSVQHAATDAAAAARTIAATTAPAGVEFTAGQAANDPGLLALEQTLARSRDQDFRTAFSERAREQNKALAENLRRVEESAAPSEAVDFFAGRMAELRNRAEQLNEDAQQLAQARASFNVPEAAEVGGNLQGALEAEQARVKAEIAALDEAIDPDGTLSLPTEALKASVRKIYEGMSREEALSLTPEERAIVDIVRGYAEALPYRNFRSLRTQINEDMRNARRAGKNRAYGRLSQLRGALEQDVENAVSGHFADDARASEEAVSRARDWYEKGAAGRAAAAGPGVGAEAPTPGVPGPAGARGAARGEPDAPAGREGLPEDAERAAREAVEGRAPPETEFDQAAHEAATSPRNGLPEPTEAQKKAANLISLFERADASTVQHELAHHYLEMFRSMGTAPDAPGPIAADWKATQAWWDKNAQEIAREAGEGVTAADVRKALRGEPAGAGKDAAIYRATHEQWARAFETYLRDGTAPNSKLKAIFEQFKQWLTSLYRNAADLGVKMSPEIRGVFARLLGEEEAPARQSRFSAAAARQLKDVTGRWKGYYRTYGDKSASPVPAIVRRSQGETYPLDMAPEAVTRAVWKKGPDGATAIRNVLEAAGSRRGEVMQGIEQSAAMSLARAAIKDGTLEPRAFDRWRAAHSDALRALPALDERFSSAADASREMLRIGKVTADAIKDAEKSAAGELLKLGPSPSDADIARKIGQMIGRQDAVKTMRGLMADAKGNPEAVAGLRAAVVDHIMAKFGGGPDALAGGEYLRAGHLRNWMTRHRAAIEQVLSPDQMRAVDAVMEAHQRIANIIRAPGGGSPTAEYLTALAERGQSPSMLAEMIRQGAINAMQSAGAGAVHAFLGGGGAGLNTALATFLSKSGLDALRARGFSKADDLIKEAILDPALMRTLLMKPTKKKGEGSARAIERAVIAGGIRGMIEGARDEEPRRYPAPRVKPLPAHMPTPMLGIRG